jgi:hypothetical protein
MSGFARSKSLSTRPSLMKKALQDIEKNRPFTIPKGEFRPKQSLGQNFLSDQNYVQKIVNVFKDDSEVSCESVTLNSGLILDTQNGCRVIELGPGPGALTRSLFKTYRDMVGGDRESII